MSDDSKRAKKRKTDLPCVNTLLVAVERSSVEDVEGFIAMAKKVCPEKVCEYESKNEVLKLIEDMEALNQELGTFKHARVLAVPKTGATPCIEDAIVDGVHFDVVVLDTNMNEDEQEEYAGGLSETCYLNHTFFRDEKEPMEAFVERVFKQ